MRTFLLVASLALIAGCATTAELANETTQRNQSDMEQLNAAVCCTPPSGLQYIDLRSGRTDVIPIDMTSPIIALATGRSHAIGFRAPQRQSTTYLTVRAFSTGSIMAPSSATFLPAFLFFNDDGTPIETPISWTVRAIRAGWVDRPSLEALIELPPSPTPTRIVVYTRPETINKRSPIIVDNGTFMVPNGVFGAVRAIWP